MGRYNSPQLKEFSSSKMNLMQQFWIRLLHVSSLHNKQQIRTTKDSIKLSHNTTRLDTTLLLGRTDRPALIPTVTPRFPKQRNNNIFDQSSQQTGMSHCFSKLLKRI